MSTFYIVATPIGNLEDITLRALRVLREVDFILCEDTRETRKLLQRHGITTSTMAYGFDTVRRGKRQERNPKIERVIELLEEGKNLALVSDAGTPAISDPGGVLVSTVREKLGDRVTVVPIPGPSAVIAALSAAGVPSSEFLFLGFLPHKKGRAKLFADIAAAERTVVFYESPHRILKSLEQLLAVLVNRPKQVVIARELTKIYEEFVSGSAAEVLAYFAQNPDKVRGEFVVIVSPK
ncbi:MAG: 16S rRNA (cytidine(1402)-2'-O)-methyltransferase [bacterium]|nr:16S rRNA (cytidine(1402)-2'-O)-methyltransferase [bacterium]MDZ4284887.1 16S rRNA (cytidine(1402)-2'-O)-methyltransferase [Patescibacteria group bacterium]